MKRQSLLEESEASKSRALVEAWPSMGSGERMEIVQDLPRHLLEDLFFQIGTEYRAEIMADLKPYQRWSLAHLMAPDDLVDLLQTVSETLHEEIMGALETSTRAEVNALLAYKEDEAGGRMNPKYARLRPDMTVDEAIRYLRALTRSQAENIYQAYVVGPRNELLGAVSLRQLFTQPPNTLLKDMMISGEKLVKVPESMHQEEVGRLFKKKAFSALPVVDGENHILGIVTVDDVLSVVQEEATEDFQKVGGMEALDMPYFQTTFFYMVRKRAGWLLILFIGEMFTATAMGYFEKEIEKAVVLALFLPLIISSGGNSGSQASTLIIRAMALGEVRLRDWWKVFFREFAVGMCLGGILGAVGLFRIIFWPTRLVLYGEHYAIIGATICLSLIGIVTWGTLAGSCLPFVLRKCGFDPATASAPFVATLVDVTGLIIYFSVASITLRGILL